jgi:hypothetical protein
MQNFLVGVRCTDIPVWVNIAETAINENNLISFNIYPNPISNGLFTVKAGTNESINKIEIFNILGQNVKTLNFDTQINKANVNVENLSHGQYLVKINTNIGTGVKKLVIR